LKVWPTQRRAQIAARGAPADAPPRRGLEIAGAFLHRAVEIVVAGDAGLPGGGDEGVAQLVRLGRVGHAERTADAVERALAARPILGAPEIGQHVVKTP